MENFDRTFGLELEFGDVVRSKVPLPTGWGWSPNERSIVNTNAKKCTPTGDIGGELNTRPLKRTLDDYRELYQVIQKCYDANGKKMWNCGFDGHLYIGDMELEQLKKLFALGYYVSTFLSAEFDVGEWFLVDHLCPRPTHEFLERVQRVETIENLANVFANSSNVGHYRFQINIMPYFKTKTLEFRIFNTTTRFRETLETIDFMYNFLEYAITHEIEDYKKIDSQERFREAFKIKKHMPKHTAPVIFAESHLQPTRNISKGFPPSRKLITAIKEHGGPNLSLVNPFHYTSELALYKTCKIKIYNNNEYSYLVQQLATTDLEIEYENHFAALNMFRDGSRETELCLFFIFSRVQKYNIKEEYGLREWESYRIKIKDSIEKIRQTAKELIAMFNQAEYVDGTLLDALSNKEVVVYQQEYNSKANSSIAALKKNSNYDKVYERKDVSYANLNIDSHMMVVSKNDFLDYHKVAKDLDTTLYSTKPKYLGLRTKDLNQINLIVDTPPDDWKITLDTPININPIPLTAFTQLQQSYVKKVSKFKAPQLAFVITSNEYVLGAIGIDMPKNDDYDVFLLSDFCTNNNVRQLSKFILFCIMSKEFKKILDRKLVQNFQNGYTLVYTTMSVSMKYRGAFKKAPSDKPKALKYEFEFGSMGTLQDVKREYIKRTK
jgi:hypothetical protein